MPQACVRVPREVAEKFQSGRVAPPEAAQHHGNVRRMPVISISHA